ncbi:ABC transporter substrate-binding protein [cf. Phormidesmis sp. LEGE 11477]|uniref:ABC transporter substrate-binding protein n=1 Tax=cf. Phormidesmis sp. LEGE 11477 TaxID=1828680 RepID=UPI0018821AE4|nr:ABC transporter substrate-binding protein [cf. Phormidesmis sp. LEGE 11477]MBE9064126.1 ABC transporter substrate-binding protein [cf. Phormidesmis sp. LEGE 11477]
MGDLLRKYWKRYFRQLGLALVGLFLVVGCYVPRTAGPTTGPVPANADLAEDISAKPTVCAEAYDSTKDYFPDKVTTEYATGFSVDYHNHYKVVTVSDPWRGADRTFQYVLVQCGTPVPTGFVNAQIVEVPVKSVVALSTTQLPHLVILDRLETLVGVSQFETVNTPEVREKIERGEIQALSSGAALDVERLLLADPDLVMTFGTGDADSDSHERLIAAGLPVALVSEYREQTPLGRAEWLKFVALFFNQERRSQQYFSEMVTAYESMKKLTADPSARPTVFSGFSYEGTWYMPGGNSYAAQLLADAGADYLWADIESNGSRPMDFEAVFERSQAADFWVNMSQDWQRKEDAIAADPRYGKLAALQNNKAYNNNAKLNQTGGNDYWESGLANPDVILADLIKIFHPERLPDHDLVYYQPLKP